LNNGHIVATIESGLALIDTGSPLTLTLNGEVCFLSRPRPAATFPFDPDVLRTFVGAEIKAIIGIDALATDPFFVDWQAGQLVFGAECPGGRQLRLTRYLGVPCTKGHIGESDVQLLVDTGATFALVREHLVNGSAVRSWRDYSPVFGWYETTLHDVTIRCGEETLAGLAGIMPERLARLLPEVDGVIGTEMLRKRSVHFDLARDVLRFI
jgi:hypothetical protein